MAEPAITRQAVHVSAGSNLPVTRIVIHATCPDVGFPAASAHGAASGTARYFAQASSGGSAHYIEGIDAEEHCVADAAIAWHAPPNAHTIGVEITADGGDASAYGAHPEHAYTRAQWLSPQVWPAVVRAAARVAELCDRLGVPKVRLSVADLQAGKHGICGHVDVSKAFHQSDHSDPGPNFPWTEFMALVVGHANAAPSRAETRPSLRASTVNVATMQSAVHVAADGQWGPGTEHALAVVHYTARDRTYPWGVKALQAVLGVTADGVAGPATAAALRTAVVGVQRGLGVAADGAWGPATEHAFGDARNRYYMHF